jgi:hypothetical protein
MYGYQPKPGPRNIAPPPRDPSGVAALAMAGPSIGRLLTLFLPDRLEVPLLKAATAVVQARGYCSLRLAHAEALDLVNHLALVERSITQGEADVLRTYFNEAAAEVSA